MDKRSNAANHNLCHFSFSDGRRCRMLRHPDHPGLCAFHSREERLRIESERIGTELAATLTGHFYTATDVNHVLGKVFTALAQDRISIKKARVLCYAAQLMLQSIPTIKDETKFTYTFESWDHMLKNAIHLPDPLYPLSSSDDVDSDAEESTSPVPDAANVGKAGPEARGNKTNPSPTTAGSAPLGVGPSGPTYGERGQRPHLSSPHPSAPSADACGGSCSDTDEDTTKEPALAGAGPNHRRGS